MELLSTHLYKNKTHRILTNTQKAKNKSILIINNLVVIGCEKGLISFIDISKNKIIKEVYISQLFKLNFNNFLDDDIKIVKDFTELNEVNINLQQIINIENVQIKNNEHFLLFQVRSGLIIIVMLTINYMNKIKKCYTSSINNITNTYEINDLHLTVTSIIDTNNESFTKFSLHNFLLILSTQNDGEFALYDIEHLIDKNRFLKINEETIFLTKSEFYKNSRRIKKENTGILNFSFVYQDYLFLGYEGSKISLLKFEKGFKSIYDEKFVDLENLNKIKIEDSSNNDQFNTNLKSNKKVSKLKKLAELNINSDTNRTISNNNLLINDNNKSVSNNLKTRKNYEELITWDLKCKNSNILCINVKNNGNEDKSFFYLFVTCYNTDIEIYRIYEIIHSNNSEEISIKVELFKVISDCCFESKVGIPCMSFYEYKNNSYFLTGGFDYRCRLYNLKELLEDHNVDRSNSNLFKNQISRTLEIFKTNSIINSIVNGEFQDENVENEIDLNEKDFLIDINISEIFDEINLMRYSIILTEEDSIYLHYYNIDI